MNTVTLNTHDLHRAVKTAALFAGSDATLPTIRGVVIDVLPSGDVVFSATDRFRIGVVRITATECENIGSGGVRRFFLGLDDAKNLVPILKVPARDVAHKSTTITVDDRTLAWDTGTTSGSFRNLGLEHQSPKLWALVDATQTAPIGHGEPEPVASRFAVNPAYLASFAKAAWSERDQMIVEPNSEPGRPCMIRIGTHFLGFVMPVRRSGDGADSRETRDAWLDLVNTLAVDPTEDRAVA